MQCTRTKIISSGVFECLLNILELKHGWCSCSPGQLCVVTVSLSQSVVKYSVHRTSLTALTEQALTALTAQALAADTEQALAAHT